MRTSMFGKQSDLSRYIDGALYQTSNCYQTISFTFLSFFAVVVAHSTSFEVALKEIADRLRRLETAQIEGFEFCEKEREAMRTSMFGKQSDLSRLVSKNVPEIQKLKLAMAGLRQDLKNITGGAHKEDQQDPPRQPSSKSKFVEVGEWEQYIIFFKLIIIEKTHNPCR
jgi:hypothetical protein